MVIFHSYVSLPQCKGNDSWSIKAYDMSGHLSPQEISRNPSLFHISFMHGKCALCKFIKPYQDYQANTCQYTIILRIPTLGLFCLTRGKYSERVKLCSDSEPVRVWVAFWILWVDAKEVSVTSPKWWIPSGNLTQLLKMTIYSGFSHKKLWFSIVMLVYQRVHQVQDSKTSSYSLLFFWSRYTDTIRSRLCDLWADSVTRGACHPGGRSDLKNSKVC